MTCKQWLHVFFLNIFCVCCKSLGGWKLQHHSAPISFVLADRVVVSQDVEFSETDGRNTHLEQAGMVGVLDNALGFVLESGQGIDRESGLVLGLELDLGWEFGQELLQVSVLGPPQESDQDTGPGKSQVVQGPLEHDQVSGLRRFHLETGCTVSGTPLKCEH